MLRRQLNRISRWEGEEGKNEAKKGLLHLDTSPFQNNQAVVIWRGMKRNCKAVLFAAAVLVSIAYFLFTASSPTDPWIGEQEPRESFGCLREHCRGHNMEELTNKGYKLKFKGARVKNWVDGEELEEFLKFDFANTTFLLTDGASLRH